MFVVECLHSLIFITISLRSTTKVQDLACFFVFNLTAFFPQCWLYYDCSLVITNIIMLFSCFLEKIVYALLSFGVILIVHAVVYVGYYCNKQDVSLVVTLFLLASVMTVLKNVFQPIKLRILFIIIACLAWDMHLYLKDPNVDNKHIC